ncbi:PLC-like phosphodiesterase [Testicularia cyperi]|uniref:PLC-like phosphodiesterase n=1 Tax=Testicularia cyperi TaxID=1882483 RepID=A0A317XXN7_9BASI|nr:PLC-like phosphodiesterase [Testicularia cyperi]
MRPITRSFKMQLQPDMPECWGHRGASATYPENTIASFEKAIQDGSEGLETDVHITTDNVIVMFHDPTLERTTNGKGLIYERSYYGENGIEHLRTLKQPAQQIPTFRQVCDLLMRPGCQHVKLNLDIKPDNNPDRLFPLMREVVASYPNYETDLAPRLILGLWHPKFLRSALDNVPSMKRIHIGASPRAAREFFWKDCSGFSMYFASLVGSEGQAFIADAQRAGKDIYVWTVNRKDEMIEATRWGVKAVLTDKTALFQDLRKDMVNDFASTRQDEVGLFFRWATWRYYQLPQFVLQTVWLANIAKRAGAPFKAVPESPSSVASVAPAMPNTASSSPVLEKVPVTSTPAHQPLAVNAAA